MKGNDGIASSVDGRTFKRELDRISAISSKIVAESSGKLESEIVHGFITKYIKRHATT